MIDEITLRKLLHDLNNVMTVAMSSADLLLLDTAKTSPARLDLEHIVHACEQGRLIVEKIRSELQ